MLRRRELFPKFSFPSPRRAWSKLSHRQMANCNLRLILGEEMIFAAAKDYAFDRDFSTALNKKTRPELLPTAF
jgi:hypothetical protein